MSVGGVLARLFSIATLAVLPGFLVFSVFHNNYPEIPTTYTLVAFVNYAIKSIFMWVGGILSMFVYADIAFPTVINVYTSILEQCDLPKIQKNN